MSIKSFIFLLSMLCCNFLAYNQTFPQLHKEGPFLGYKDVKGQWIIRPQFIWIEQPYSNRMVVQDGADKMGIINGKGEFVVNCIYQKLEKQKMRDGTRLFHGGYLALKNDLLGLVDTLGQAVVPVEFEVGKWLNKSTLYFNRNGRQLALDEHGKIIFEGNYAFAEMTSSPRLKKWYFRAMENGKMGLIDWDKKIILPFDYKALIVWPGELVHCIHFDGRHSLTVMEGKEILPALYKNLKFDGYGFIMATDFETGKSGYLDTTGIVRLPLEFKSCGIVTNGVLGIGHYFKAAKTKEYALFNPSGKQLTEYIYNDLSCSTSAPMVFMAQLVDKKMILLDTFGVSLSESPVDKIKVDFTAISIRNDNKAGLATLEGRQVTEIKYDSTDGFLSKKDLHLLNEEYSLKPPISIIGRATLGDQIFYITNQGQELLMNSKEKTNKPIEELNGKESLVKNSKDDLPLKTPEISPEFPGGESALQAYIANNLRYPKIASENGIQGTAVVNFVVERDGSITNIQLARDLGNGCGQQALILVQKMPKWIPGSDKGETTRVLMTLPVIFKLDGK